LRLRLQTSGNPVEVPEDRQRSLCETAARKNDLPAPVQRTLTAFVNV
jgi:hypothetical protein